MIRGNRRERSREYQRGESVEIRARDEILATLDADGKLDGLPFQPEMLKLCGGKFKVYRRAEKIFLDRHYYVAALKDTVLLAGLRCDGEDHGGCRMGCLFLWKEAWLKPPSGEDTTRGGDDDENSSVDARLPVTRGDHYCCQATELVAATSPVAWWDIRQYVRDLTSGELTPRQFVRMLMLSAYNKTMRILGRPPYGEVYGRQTKTPAGPLNLMLDELVEVKTKEEIRATLDSRGKNRGLGFGGSMVDYCGGRYRVANRVDRFILEWSGEMRNLTDTVVLEEVTCDGLDKRGCPRLCYHLWREIWLKRVP